MSTGFRSWPSGLVLTPETIWSHHRTVSKAFPLTPRNSKDKVQVHSVLSLRGSPEKHFGYFLRYNLASEYSIKH